MRKKVLLSIVTLICIALIGIVIYLSQNRLMGGNNYRIDNKVLVSKLKEIDIDASNVKVTYLTEPSESDGTNLLGLNNETIVQTNYSINNSAVTLSIFIDENFLNNFLKKDVVLVGTTLNTFLLNSALKAIGNTSNNSIDCLQEEFCSYENAKIITIN